MTGSITVATADEMEAFGRRIATILRPGDIILLNGSLGAGKTLLVSGIAQALGVEIQVTSPTFLVVRKYDDGLLPLTHVDVYRLRSTGEFTDLELVEGSTDGVLVIEWGSVIRSALPADVLNVELQVESNGARSVRLVGEGEWRNRLLTELTD